MPYRNIFISNQSLLKLKNNQLVVNNGEEFTFPVEDIRSIVIDNPLTTLSARLISYLAENGVCLIVCDQKHTPNCQFVPVGSYCRVSKRINLQIEQSKPKLKRIWQQIIIKKIENQAECLKLFEIEENEKLLTLSKAVQSGDSNNREGYAASVYFKALFGNDFTRDKENNINAALNYGYAVIRSFIAKTIVSYGLEPSIGVHHKNQLNAFNLADDLIEPFRPVVYLFVAKTFFTDKDFCFDTYKKAELVRLLNSAVFVDKDRCSLATAVEYDVQSLIFSYENDDIALKLPSLIDTSYFDYD